MLEFPYSLEIDDKNRVGIATPGRYGEWYSHSVSLFVKSKDYERQFRCYSHIKSVISTIFVYYLECQTLSHPYSTFLLV